MGKKPSNNPSKKQLETSGFTEPIPVPQEKPDIDFIQPPSMEQRKYGGKVCLIVPSYNGAFLGKNLPALMTLHDLGVVQTVIGGMSLICRARSWIATQLHPMFEQLIWVDSDILFTAEQVIALIEEPGDIVAGIYPKRAMNQGWAVTPIEETQIDYDHRPEPEPRDPKLGGYVRECGGVGFGFVRTASRIFPHIKAHHDLPTSPDGITPFFLPAINQEGKYIGEDYAFCLRAIQSGIRVWARGDIRVKHVGELEFDETTAGAPDPFCTHAWRGGKCVYCKWAPPPAMNFS